MRDSAQGPTQKLKCRERVGFSALPDQLVNYELARGFTLNIMLVGLCRIPLVSGAKSLLHAVQRVVQEFYA